MAFPICTRIMQCIIVQGVKLLLFQPSILYGYSETPEQLSRKLKKPVDEHHKVFPSLGGILKKTTRGSRTKGAAV